MKISIAMATFNGAEFLQEQLNSFLLQTRLPDELVVCDDMSTDESVEILEKFRQRSPFCVRIVRNENNLGYAKNFEKAISLCSGDIIFLSDQDDFWLETKIEKISAILGFNTAVAVVHNNMYVCDRDLKTTGVTTFGQARSIGMSYASLSYGCSTAFKANLKEFFKNIPNAYSHDVWINEVGRKLELWKPLDEPLQLYRRHGKNASNSLTSQTNPVAFNLGDLKNKFTTDVKPYESKMALARDLEKLFSLQNDLNSKRFDRLRVKSSLKMLKLEINSLNSRINLMRNTFPVRQVQALAMLITGEYKFFSGSKSFIKDFFSSPRC